MKDQVLDLVKEATALNLRYSWLVLNLSKEYIKDAERVIKGNVANSGAAASQPQPAPVRRPPILLVGKLGEEAKGE